MQEIISRKNAREQGLKFYFTGKPCVNGHTVNRYASNKKCILCDAARRARWCADNPEKVIANNLKWRTNNHEKNLASAKEWVAAHRERHCARGKAWNKDNPDRVLENNRAWRASNIETSRAYCRNRHARKRNAEGSHTAQDIADLYAAQKGRCAYCKVKVGNKYDVDHIIPLIKGGSNYKRNLQICCPSCNRRKSAKDQIDFSREIGFLI